MDLSLNPERRLIMSMAMRQALEILQMSQVELSQWLKNEIEKNPLLEYTTPSTSKRFEAQIAAQTTLHEHLLNQIRENFSSPIDRMIAEEFLENLDERGFITCSTDAIDAYFRRTTEPVLSILQTFDPPGIFARNLQEALLLQLKARGRTQSLAYKIATFCYEDLLHGRYAAIKKKLFSTDLGAAMQELARLSMRPASAFHEEPVQPIYPDLSMKRIEGGWSIELIEDEIPKFHIQSEYLTLPIECPEERESHREFKTQAKWICRSIQRRRKLIQEIGRILVCKQAAYLDQKGPLAPISVKDLAEKLEIHESTLSRALSGKYASTPRGIIPLRSLITATPQTQTAREILESLVEGEDKESPLTDDQLAKELQKKGFSIARRTIAKYRTQLKIGSASQRKHTH